MGREPLTLPQEATHQDMLGVSVVVPTYREAENLPELIERLAEVRAHARLDLELVIIDDDSRDGTADAVAMARQDWVRLVVRTGERGLSTAVIKGFSLATKEYIVVMDADLSHPPEVIPRMLERLLAGADFVVGSRYTQGGQTAGDWGILRWMNSRGATLLARPFTSIQDPMSGFFAFRRAALENAAHLNPVGYKIGLELLVKGRFTRVEEVPIYFADRARGESKLTWREHWRYLKHLRRLAEFKYGNAAHFIEFAIVGASGVVVNLGILTLLLLSGAPLQISVAVAILVSMLTNFILNRRITFSYAREGNFWLQMAGFFVGSSFGAMVNYVVTMLLLYEFPALLRLPQAASLAGILAGLLFNYMVSRYLVFRKGPYLD
jgi:dolichol-phosphate mannosyltransferase